MALWRRLIRGLRALVRRDAVDRDIDDEVRHYIDEQTAEYVARGMTPEAARRAARLDLGSPSALRDEVRASGWEHVVSTIAGDLRYSVRRLRAQPAFTAVAVATLAIGIGATTAIFSAVNPILFEPLPYPRAREIVTVWDYAVDGARVELTFGTFRELVERARAFEAVAVMRPWQPTLTGGAEPERLDGQRVSADYFRALGVLPAAGAVFRDSDDRTGGPNVVVIGDGLWRRRFAADPAIVGRQIMLNDLPFTVVGVMPRDFENLLAPSADVWAPLQYNAALPADGREWGHHLRLVARLRRGVDADTARREVVAIAQTPIAAFWRPPWAQLARGLIVSPLHDDVTRDVRPALVAVLGAVTLLLVIACVNVTSLVLGRGAQRRTEMAMRAALGAGRARLMRQLLTESLLLAAFGGAFGMLLAQAGVRALVAISPQQLPRLGAIRVDGATLLFGVVATTLVGIVVGVIPAFQASHGDLQISPQQGSGRTSLHRGPIRRALVVAEVALALVLLVSAGLLFRSLQQLFAVAPGFDPTHVLTMQVQTSSRRFTTDSAATRRFFAQALQAVRQVPGVANAAFTSQLPLSGDFEKYGVQFEADPDTDPNQDGSALRYAVTADYFTTMRIPLRRGRLLDAHDVAGAMPAVVINESFARRKFRGADPIGRRVHVGNTNLPWYTIVGVVGDVKHTTLAAALLDAAYTTTDQWAFPDNPLTLVVRARGDAASLGPAVRDAIWSVDKDQPIVRMATMDELVTRSAAERRFALLLFESFGFVALVLAAVGLYGVLAGSVTERTREIGIRAALGAEQMDIVSMIVRQGLGLAAVGGALGIAGAMLASRALATLLFGISRVDPATYVAVFALLAGVSAIACWIPASRAARIDPSVTLRVE